ncbi:MAG: DNA polymerase III subunit epsilon [Rickettsiales bacterium]
MREIVLDTETTGLDPSGGHRIIEIGCIEIENRIKTGRVFHKYINPKRDVPDEAFRVHGISSEFLKDKPCFEDVCDEFLNFIGEEKLVIHNAKFDMKFINFELSKAGKPEVSFERAIDTLIMARKKYPGSPASLDALCKRFGVSLESREKHGALLDSELLFEVYFELCGGRQNKLELSYKSKKVDKGGGAELAPRIDIPKRDFVVSEEEEALHAELLKKINNPLWQKA